MNNTTGTDTLLLAENVRPITLDSQGGLSLVCRRNSITVLTGPSAEETASWLATLAGLRPLGAGRLHLPEDTREERNGIRQQVGYVDTNTPLLSTLDVRMNVMLPRLYHCGDSFAAAAQDADALLDRLDFKGPRDEPPARLTAFQHLQALVARALSLDPPLVFIDEPFSMSTITSWSPLAASIRALARDNGRGVIIATRDIPFAAAHADQLAFVDGAFARAYPSWQEFAIAKEPAAFLQQLPFDTRTVS